MTGSPSLTVQGSQLLSSLPAHFAIDLCIGWSKADPAGDSIRGVMLGMHVRDNQVDVLLPQPIRHELCRLPCVPSALLRYRDHPRDVSSQVAGLLADGGLHEADRLPVVASPHDPVEPALRPVGRLANDLLGIEGAEFLKSGRFATDEGAQCGIVQQRCHLISVLHAQRLECEPFA
jgi:hypothetical protein